MAALVLRAKLRAGAGFSWASCSGIGTLNGEYPQLYKRSELRRPSDMLLWVEENDPRGENLGSWIMNAGAPPGFAGSTFIGSPAVFHGQSSTFNFADGHSESRKWQDGATIAYAASMNLNKYSSRPAASLVEARRALDGEGLCHLEELLKELVPVSADRLVAARFGSAQRPPVKRAGRSG